MPSKGYRDAGSIFHSVIKFLCAYWGEGHAYDVEMEDKAYKFKTENPCIPDVVFRRGKNPHKYKVLFIEVQGGLNTKKKREKYLEECRAKYGIMPFIVVDLDSYDWSPEPEAGTPEFTYYLYHIADELFTQLDNETNYPVKKRDKVPKKRKEPDDEWIMFEGHRIKKKNLWKYKKREEYEKTSG